MFKYIGIGLVTVLLTGCAYTESAIQYAEEGTKRVKSGYDAKIKMTTALVEYLKTANADCGVKTTVDNGIPVTTVKECVRIDDVLASVDRVEIVKPQSVGSITNGLKDLLVGATNIGTVALTTYYGHKEHEMSMTANMANTASNNQLQGTIFEGYVNNFDKTTITDSSNNTTNDSTSTTLTDTSTTITDTSTSTTSNVVDFTTDGTTTTVGD